MPLDRSRVLLRALMTLMTTSGTWALRNLLRGYNVTMAIPATRALNVRPSVDLKAMPNAINLSTAVQTDAKRDIASPLERSTADAGDPATELSGSYAR